MEKLNCVRSASEEDFPALSAIHEAMGLDYQLPLDDPLLVVKKVIEKDGKIIGACFIRIAAETMLLLDPELGPCEKMDAMEAMQPEVLAEAWKLGFNQVEARIEATTEKIFEKRLKQLGWVRDRENWHPWSRECVLP